MSIITVGGHEVTRNLSEPRDQTLMHIDVYADNYYILARATEEKLKQMANKVETTDKEREKMSKKTWRK